MEVHAYFEKGIKIDKNSPKITKIYYDNQVSYSNFSGSGTIDPDYTTSFFPFYNIGIKSISICILYKACNN